MSTATLQVPTVPDHPVIPDTDWSRFTAAQRIKHLESARLACGKGGETAVTRATVLQEPQHTED